MKKVLFMLAFILGGIGLATAQTSKVSGLVIGAEDGEPVIGASIVVKGTGMGTITDVDGKFVIENLPSSAKTLVVSYVGMTTQEVTIHPFVKVTMQSDAEVLEAVVITGYGSAKKLGSVVGSAVAVSLKICSFIYLVQPYGLVHDVGISSFRGTCFGTP